MTDRGILDGLDVLDLSWGIAGPMTGMLLADHGARVTRIEPPTGDPFAGLSGTRVWLRGKRRATLDLRDEADREVFLELARRADVVIESFAPGVAERLGIDHRKLLAANPRLVHCSITGYGESGAHADRPAYDALVAARTGQQFESRGVVGTTIGRLSGAEVFPGYEAPEGCMIGAPRSGPLFSGIPWISLATFYNASIAINAALVAREVTGKGQHVHTSMLQGALATTVGAWQRAERADREGFNSWIFDPRAPKGFFQGSDGKWTHHWVPLPGFILNAGELDRLEPGPDLMAPRDAPMRISPAADDMFVIHGLQEQMAEAVAKFPADDWAELAAAVGVPVQRVRAPEEALLDPLLLEDGSVVEVDGVRMVGRTYQFEKTPAPAIGGVAEPGAHTAAVRAEAATPAPPAAARPAGSGRRIASPLEGVVVLDLGLAVAGPFGTQLLADLGATVIKVNNALFDSFWMQTSIAMCCNRGKQSITIDLKDPEGMAVLHDLVRTADVVQHNMRYDAAERLGVDYESLRELKPDLDLLPHARARPGPDAAARQRPDRRRPRRLVVDGGGGRVGRDADLAQHVARRHGERLPLCHRHHAGALPPHAHRRWAVPRHVDPLRAPAEHVDDVGACRRHAGEPARARRHADGVERPVPAARDRRRVAVRRARHRPTRRGLRTPHGRQPVRADGAASGSPCSTAPACRARWPTPTSCCRCSTIRR